jgi:peptide alpha-N-acetyltransferase
MKRKTEAYDIIKKALFKNLGNFTCWHVYGLINKNNRQYQEAKKAYLNALRYDQDN